MLLALVLLEASLELVGVGRGVVSVVARRVCFGLEERAAAADVGFVFFSGGLGSEAAGELLKEPSFEFRERRRTVGLGKGVSEVSAELMSPVAEARAMNLGAYGKPRVNEDP